MTFRTFCTRMLSVFMLMAFLLVSGLQIAESFSPAKQKTPAREEIELAALLPAHAPVADVSLKIQKSVSDFCFFSSGPGLVADQILLSDSSSFFFILSPQFVRLLVSCIAINAP